MPPEQKSRQQIDQQLDRAGWIVRDYGQMNISAGSGVAVREFPLKTGDADYMLYADSKTIGVVEAQPKGHTLIGVETQSGKYLDGLPKILPNSRLPLPSAYESTSEFPQFTNTLEPNTRNRVVFTCHRPEELIRLVKLEKQVRTQASGDATAEFRDRRCGEGDHFEYGPCCSTTSEHSQQACEGKLVPQDPTDEPASATLSRIRTVHTIRATSVQKWLQPTPVRRSVG